MTDDVPTVPGLEAGSWQIDPAHSEVTFSIRHLMTTVRGNFTDFGGHIDVRPHPADSMANAHIAMASIDTRSAERDEHVRSSDFLDVATYPTMTFSTTYAKPASVGRRARQPHYAVGGDLTIRGVTRPVELLTVFYGVETDHFGGVRAGFGASTSIYRSDFGIEFNIPLQGDRLVLGDQIDIQLEIQAVRT